MHGYHKLSVCKETQYLEPLLRAVQCFKYMPVNQLKQVMKRV